MLCSVLPIRPFLLSLQLLPQKSDQETMDELENASRYLEGELV
jgi:hypothetical protein